MSKQSKQAPNAIGVTREEMVCTLRLAWNSKVLDQKEVCAALQINQGHFSRLIRGNFVKPVGHAARLFAYAKMKLDHRSISSQEVEMLRDRLTQQLMSAWDETLEGALALSEILEGVKQFRHSIHSK